jgi:hypothetical protein
MLNYLVSFQKVFFCVLRFNLEETSHIFFSEKLFLPMSQDPRWSIIMKTIGGKKSPGTIPLIEIIIRSFVRNT